MECKLNRNAYLVSLHLFHNPPVRAGSTKRRTAGPQAGTHMDAEKISGPGFLRATKARHAEEAIGHSEGLVTVLRLTQADLKPAEEALTIAKQFFEMHHYSKAFQAAKRAEALAITLDERFSGYQKAAAVLKSRLAAMRRLGLRVDPLDAVLGQAEEKILSGVWENGAFVPNYLEARVLLEGAEQDGRGLQEKAERASNAIFMAEIAIEALANLKDLADPAAFARGATSDLERSLHNATRELALGNADAAAKIGADLEATATRRKAGYADTRNSLAETDTQLADLRGEGVLTQTLEGQLRIANETLAKGLIEPAAAMAGRLGGEAKSLAELYRRAATGLSDAEILYSRLHREGFHSYEADAALRDARRAVREGSYARAVDHLERTLQAFARRTNARVALSQAIEETRTRVRLLQGSGLVFMPDIQEVLGRAEREFHQGNFTGSSEDLRIAVVLLDQVTRAPTPKK